MKSSAGLVALATLAIALPLPSCEGRARISTPTAVADAGPKSYGRGKILEVDLTGGAPESMDAGSLFGRPASRTFVGLVRSLERASQDEDATGIFVRMGGASLGFAKSDEVADLLAGLRKTGTPVVCHSDGLGNSSVWMTHRGCDRVWVSPAGDVEAIGIAGQTVHLKGALEKLEIRADFLHVGKYKSFAETFTEEQPSDAARESLLGVLGSIRGFWLDGVADARTKAALEQGPWTPSEAKDRGLVHEVGYESEALDDAQTRGAADRVELVFGAKAPVGGGFGLVEIIRALTGADDRSGGRPHIAVVPLVGGITMGGGDLFGDSGITLNATKRTLRAVAEDESARVVVLRIDSPGGSALASDLLWHEIRELRKKKKVVASIGEMAASGGYYLASACDEIISGRTSIVGSIGVVGGKIVIGQALARYGVTSATLAASDAPGAAERAAYLSALVPWNDEMRGRVRTQMVSVYDLFIDRVAKGRNVPGDQIRPHAEGRIWSGAQGKDRKLVDEVGGLSSALARARVLGDLDDSAPVVVTGVEQSLLELLALEEGASAEAIEAALQRRWSAPPRPFDLVDEDARALARAVLPLAMGERVVAAMPVGFVVR